jgi:hypothetical protein
VCVERDDSVVILLSDCVVSGAATASEAVVDSKMNNTEFLF